MQATLKWVILSTLLLITTIIDVHFSMAHAKPQPLRVVTTTPDLAWIVGQIGRELVEVESLLSSTDDPHFVDVRPDYVAKVMKADVVCLIGLDLEIGWMPKVLKKSGRKQIQPGGSGYCEFGKKVDALDKPNGLVDRSMGDVHPNGNPHFWLSPTVFSQAAQEALAVMIALRPEHRSVFNAQYNSVQKRMSELEKTLKQKLKMAGIHDERARFIQYHKEFEYFAHSFGMRTIAEIEDKPGMKPSASRLAEIGKLAVNNDVKMILASVHASKTVVRKFEDVSGKKVQVVPVSLTNFHEDEAYTTLLDNIAERLIQAQSTPTKSSK